MEFFAHWESQLDSSIKEFAQFAATNEGIDFRYGWLAAALLWPIRTPIQEFEGDAMDAVREITGKQTKHILKAIQSWDEDRISAARDLSGQAKGSPEFALALSAIINRFDAATAFAACLAQILMQQRGAGDIYNINEQIKAALVNIGGVMNIESLAINFSLPQVPVAITKERRNELALLQKVQTYWIEGVLERSLYGAALLEVNVQPVAAAVDALQPEMMLDLPDRSGEDALPPSTHLIDVFDNLEKEGDPTLLILGEPGSGKTITLLDMARDMLARARREVGHPLPVVLNLSAWGEKRLPFDKWLVEDLNQKYQIPKKIGRIWLENQSLLLLLDGLDEVSTDSRNACVEAINTFRLEHGLLPIVVCSRIQEYEVLKHHLRFQRAIRLLPLAPEQIEAHIQAIGEPLSNLRLALTQDETLRDLARSPLMLNVMSLAYRDLQAQTLISAELQPAEARRKHLFNIYVKRMFERRSGEGVYSPSQTVIRLRWLAQYMLWHNQFLFSLENLQPTWLSSKSWRWLYLLLSRPIAGIGAMGAITAFLVYWLSDAISLETLTFCLILSVISGFALAGVDALWVNGKAFLSVGLYSFITNKSEDAFARITMSFILFTWMIGYFAVALLGMNGIDTGIIFIPILFGGIPFALIFGRRVGLYNILFRIDVRTRENLNYSWTRFRRILLYGSILPGILIFAVTQILFLYDLHNELFLWNAQDGNQVEASSEVTSEIRSIEFSPDAGRLVSISRDGRIQLWNGHTGELIKTLKGDTDSISISAYEDQLTALNNRLEVFRALGIRTASSQNAVFSSDSTRLVTTTNDGILRFWNAQTGQPISTQMGSTSWISTAIFSPDGTRLVTASADGTGQLWDGRSGAPVQTQMGQIFWYGAVVFSPDGSRLITINYDSAVQLWDGRTGKLVMTLDGQTDKIVSAEFNRDGTRLVTTNLLASAQLWDGQTGELVNTLGENINLAAIFNRDGTQLVTSDNALRIQQWDGQTGKLLNTLQLDTSKSSGVYKALFNPDGTRLVTVGESGMAYLWDVQTGNLIETLELGTFSYLLSNQLINKLMFSPDGSRLVTTIMFSSYDDRLGRTYNEGVKLWDGQTGKLVNFLEGHTDQVDNLVFSSNGSRLMTAGRDGIVQLWDTKTGRRIKMLDEQVSSARISSDGTQIATVKKVSDNRGWTILAIFGLFFGFLASFKTGVVETKRTPNQGIHLTARNAFVVALFVAGLVFITIFTMGLLFALSDGMVFQYALANNFNSANLVFYSALSGTIALLVFMGYGGLDVIYHYVLRLLLILQGHTPTRYAHFLDYASERIFLQKVGGSYIFIHRLLLEHFASLPDTDIADLFK